MWLRLGISHMSTPLAAKPATQVVAREPVQWACKEASKVSWPGDKAQLGEGVLVQAFLCQMRLVAEWHSVTTMRATIEESSGVEIHNSSDD